MNIIDKYANYMQCIILARYRIYVTEQHQTIGLHNNTTILKNVQDNNVCLTFVHRNVAMGWFWICDRHHGSTFNVNV